MNSQVQRKLLIILRKIQYYSILLFLSIQYYPTILFCLLIKSKYFAIGAKLSLIKVSILVFSAVGSMLFLRPLRILRKPQLTEN